MNCPVCGRDAPTLLTKSGIPIRDCSHCRHRYAAVAADESHARRVYSDEYFTAGGAGYSDYQREADLLRGRGRFYAELLRRHVLPGRLLDVGAAAGFLLEGLCDGGFEGEGVEVNAGMAALARERGLRVETSTYETFAPRGRYDAITMIQVVAHVYDVRETFRRATEQLNPGGVLLVETWDSDSRAARILGRRWHEYSPPSVLNMFSRRSLRRLAEQHGLRHLDSATTRKRIEVAHARELLEHSLRDSWLRAPLATLLAVLPGGWSLVYPGDDLFWSLFRKPAD